MINEKDLNAYLETWVARRFPRFLGNRFFQGTLVTVTPAAAGTYLCTLSRTNESTADGMTYLCSTPAYFPTVGDVVECVWLGPDGDGLILWPLNRGTTEKLDDQSSGALAASLTLTVPGPCTVLEVFITGRGDATAQGVVVQFNGDTGGNYYYQFLHDANATITALAPAVAQTSGRCGAVVPSTAAAGAHGESRLVIFNADSKTMRKSWQWFGGRWDTDLAAGSDQEQGQGQWNNTVDRISSIKVFPAAGNFVNARAVLYGRV